MIRSLLEAPALRMGVFVFVAVVVTGGAHFYLYQRIFVPLLGPDEGGLSALLVLLWANLFFGFGLLRILPNPIRQIYEAVLFVWMGLALFLLMASGAVLATMSLTSFAATEGHVAAGSLALALFLAFVSFRTAQRHVVLPTSLAFLPLRVSERSGQLAEGLHHQTYLDEIRIVVLSDVHVSGLVGARRIRRIVNQVNALDPDIIFVVGDLVDGTVRQLGEVVSEFKSLHTRQPGQIYYVTGNHEYYSGAESWKAFLRERLSWQVLENQLKTIEIGGHRLHIAGLEDRQSLRGSNPLGPKAKDDRLEKALNGLPVSLPDNEKLIVLTHQPKDTDMVMSSSRVSLQVSGHTHAGQIWPFGFVVKRDQRYLKGLFEVNPRQYLYVCQGTGFWGLPFRLGTLCEIGLLRLQKEIS